MVARDEQFHVNRAVGSGELQMKLVEKSHRLPILEDSGESEVIERVNGRLVLQIVYSILITITF